MKVLNCEFPDDVHYDVESDTWCKVVGDGGRIGITSALSFLAGRILKAKLRSELNEVSVGKSLGTIESATYFGAIRSPVAGKISSLNLKLQDSPRMLNDFTYSDGWVAEFSTIDKSSLSRLYFGESAREKLAARIKELRVNCFKLLPDDQMYSIGTECSTTLANLNDLMEKLPVGNVVHLVTDDQTADIELVRWTMRTKNELVEARKEGNLYHFIVRKSESDHARK